MTFKDFILSMLTDSEGGGISSKRVIGLSTFLVFLALVFINTYTDRRTPETFIDGLMYIILGAFLGGTLEYFSKRQTSTTVKTGDNAEVVVNDSVPDPVPGKPLVIVENIPPSVAPLPALSDTDIIPADEGKLVETKIVDKNIAE